MARIYSLQEKIAALDQMATERLIDVSARLDIPVPHLRRWRREADYRAARWLTNRNNGR
jgi:hypothetical protein